MYVKKNVILWQNNSVGNKNTTMNKEQLLPHAVTAAVLAGTDIMNIYLDPEQDFGIEKKADNSPLTLADKAAHKRIVGILAETGIPVLSEESAKDDYKNRQEWQCFWLVDPLDGTKEFIKKNGEFTVNIALVENGSPTMGVVYVPAKDELYYGTVGVGAYKATRVIGSFAQGENDGEGHFNVNLNTEILPLASAKHDDYVIVASRSHLSPETQAFIDEAERTYPNVRTISSGSSIKICLVAEGTADAYPRYAPTMEWDTAAGDAVARAAGKMCYQAGSYDGLPSNDGEPLEYNKEDLHNPWFLVK